MPIHDSILGTIGHTPVVRLQRIAPPHVDLYVKVESFNPGGSVKDRLALAIVLDAEKRGLLRPGDTIVEAPPATPASPWRWSRPRAATGS